jgi:glycosyltransferase involved in cell wall biosynthesis
MRIVFIGHSGWEYPHTRVRCYGFAKALKERGFDTEVLSFKDHLAPGASEADMYANLRDREKMDLVWRAIRRLWKDRKHLLYVQKAHFHSAAPYLLSRFAGARYILDYDDYDIPLSNFFVKGRWNRLCFGSNKWDEITYRMARRAAGCVASSHALEEFLSEYNGNVVRIETGVDTENYYPARDKKPEDEPLTFFWNGLVWGEEIVKCVELAMDCFAKVHTTYPNTRLLIVGGGFQWQRVIDEAKAKYANVPIVFRGWMPPEAMPAVLREADVGLLPFGVENEWVKCKSPTKLFEYLACGLSVVAWDLGEAQHVISHGENGLLARDAGSMAQAMRDLAASAELRDQLGAGAKKTVEERYSYKVLGDRLAEYLKQFERA